MIKIMLGFLLVASGVGGIDASQTDTELFVCALSAALGLMLMHSALRNVEEKS